jgi:hypothetical protein
MRRHLHQWEFEFFSSVDLADICAKFGVMDTDFIEKTIRNYAQTLKSGNQTEQEASEELARIADKLKQKRQIEKIEARPNPLPIPGANRPASSL